MSAEFFMGQERRQHERISYRAPCRYEISANGNSSGGMESGTSFIKNISLGGLLIELMKSIAVDSRLDLEVVLPTTSRPIRAQARVVWANRLEDDGNRYNVGMCFTQISPEDKDKISSLKKRIETIENL